MSNSELSCSDSSFFSSSSSFSINGGLILEPAVSNNSFLRWVSPAAEQSFGKGSSVSSSSNLCRFKAVGVGGGRFLSVSLTSDGIVRETKRCLVQNGYEDAVVEERKKKNQKIRVRKGAAVNTTKHLWAGAIAAIVSRTFVAPLERLKLEYIVRGEQKNLFDLVKTIAVSQA
ncbi:probable mitochondrial adenine nucleotide transporter BTL2 [Morus notabilis]|uniref:probable mitochondrial adenine nucleotide transporter BTL2 n=1 Tax=Morus notabilis TaxID=981085 RepID=UPI000CED3958|nr:probable mitochondrial adenine nucleotide transporter BTL2 [Morus notabilis]